MREYVLEFDDLCDATLPRLKVLRQLKDKYPDLRATLFTIPQRCSDLTIKDARSEDWLSLAPHGWWHTRGECFAWNAEQAVAYLKAAANRGIDAPMFRAPAWLLDVDVYTACKELDYTVCDHKLYHVNVEGAKVYRYNDVLYRKAKTTAIHGHLTKSEHIDNTIDDMLKDGRLDLNKTATYLTPNEASVLVTVGDPAL